MKNAGGRIASLLLLWPVASLAADALCASPPGRSNLENNNEIYSLAQYEASQLEKIKSNVNNTNNSTASTQPQQQQQHQSIELTENKPRPITSDSINKQQHQQDQKQENLLAVDLDAELLSPELSTKTCVDVDEKKASTSNVVDLQQFKRENPNSNHQSISITNKNSIATDPSSPSSTTDHISKEHVPSVPSFRAIQHHQELFRRNQLSKSGISSTVPPKFIEEKRPKSVTASVFRITNEKPTVSGSAVSLTQNIGHNSILLNQSNNLPQLNVAPSAQSVTASVFTPISQLRSAPNLQTSQQHKKLTQPNQQQQQQQQQSSAVPRSVEMNKAYLSYVEGPTVLTMLKEEPDDLTHLAPSTGVDACLPLDDATPLFQDIMSGFMPYDTLMPHDISSLDSHNSANQTTGSPNNKGHIDPFINYREESNDTNCSQHLLSPSITSKSPEGSSLPSLCSPNSLSQEDDFPFMTMNVDDEMELSMRAPYIPMNEQEDLPLLTDDLIWNMELSSDDLGIQKDDPMQYSSLKQYLNSSTNNRILNASGNSSCITPDLALSSPSASPMSISSSSAASSPSPCSSHSSLSMHNQQARGFGGAMLCNCGGNSGGRGGGGGGGGGGDCTAGGGNSSLNVDDSDSGISSINSMSPQHTHQQHHHHSSHNQHQQQQQQHLQQQQQQQHHHHLPLSVGIMGFMKLKKEIDSAHLSDSIDAFDSVYTKDSLKNLDCWSVPEFLNINSDDSSVAVDDMQQPDKQQNLIINSATMPTNTLHVPLITIQNNKNLSMNQQRTTSSSPLSAGTIPAGGTLHNNTSSSSSVSSAATTVATSSITASSPQQSTGTTSSLSSATSNCHNNSNSNKHSGSGVGGLILSEEIIQNNRKLTGKLPTNNTAATIRISNGAPTAGGRHQQSSPKATILQTANITPLQGNNHKRHLTSGAAAALDSKRLKNSSTVEIQPSPHLLQQLMAPAPQKQRIVVKTAGGYDKSQTASRWAKENGVGKGGLQQQQHLLRNQQQQDSNINQHHNQSISTLSSSSSSSSTAAASSNSVLKNLLISGCDVSAGYCIVPVRPKKLAKA